MPVHSLLSLLAHSASEALQEGGRQGEALPEGGRQGDNLQHLRWLVHMWVLESSCQVDCSALEDGVDGLLGLKAIERTPRALRGDPGAIGTDMAACAILDLGEPHGVAGEVCWHCCHSSASASLGKDGPHKPALLLNPVAGPLIGHGEELNVGLSLLHVLPGETDKEPVMEHHWQQLLEVQLLWDGTPCQDVQVRSLVASLLHEAWDRLHHAAWDETWQFGFWQSADTQLPKSANCPPPLAWYCWYFPHIMLLQEVLNQFHELLRHLIVLHVLPILLHCPLPAIPLSGSVTQLDTTTEGRAMKQFVLPSVLQELEQDLDGGCKIIALVLLVLLLLLVLLPIHPEAILLIILAPLLQVVHELLLQLQSLPDDSSREDSWHQGCSGPVTHQLVILNLAHSWGRPSG